MEQARIPISEPCSINSLIGVFQFDSSNCQIEIENKKIIPKSVSNEQYITRFEQIIRLI